MKVCAKANVRDSNWDIARDGVKGAVKDARKDAYWGCAKSARICC